MSRQPAVAGRFYPGNGQSLEEVIKDYLPETSAKTSSLAAIVPHAGYIYSGQVAAETLGQTLIPDTVILIGPNHHGRGATAALSAIPWQLPLGEVKVNNEVIKMLLDCSDIFEVDESAHSYEHSLEVQVPILQVLRPDVSIVPLTVGHLSFGGCVKIAEALAQVIHNSAHPPLMVASTDMSHYVSREEATKLDGIALKMMEKLDPQGLFTTVLDRRISMCGFIPVTIVMHAAKLLGASKTELLRYTDSGVVSGDTNQVVGYAGALIR